MSDYSLFVIQPMHVMGKGLVEPKGYISPALREMMEAAQRGAADTFNPIEGAAPDTPSTTPDPWSKEAWGDLR